VPEEGESCSRHDRAGPEECEILDHAIARDWPHLTQIGCAHRHLDAQMGDFGPLRVGQPAISMIRYSRVSSTSIGPVRTMIVPWTRLGGRPASR